MKKNGLLFLIIVLALSLAGCGKSDEQKAAEEADVALNEKTSEEDQNPEKIKQDDAEALVKEKLVGTGCEESFADHIANDTDGYYLFSVTKDGTALDQMLAVNDISGEVVVFNTETEELEDYSAFHYYDNEKDAVIEWNGSYQNGDYSVKIEEDAPGSFYFTILEKKKEVLSGTAMPGGKTATAQTDDGTISFYANDQTLTVSSDQTPFVYAGDYTKQETKSE